MARRSRVDSLGLRAAMADRLLPLLVGAMSFLAALAIAGTLAAAALAAHWENDTSAALTIQVPDPGQPATTGTADRLAAVLAALNASPAVAMPKPLNATEIDDLLRPWLGADASRLALPIPAIITAHWQGGGTSALATALAAIAPGTLVATGARWAARVAALTTSVQASALSVLVIVALVAAAVISVATRSGLAQRREAIEIVHGLGAMDADIADSFAARALTLAFIGAALGAAIALPVLFWLARLASPFAGVVPQQAVPLLPAALWVSLPALPAAAAIIGWGTAQLTVRNWLRGLV